MRDRSTPLSPSAALVGAIAFAVVVGVWWSVVTVPAGNVGVITTFGKVEANTLEEGLNFVFPWRKVTPMSIRTEQQEIKAETPTSEGLAATLDVTIMYSLMKDRASEVYQKIGIDYKEKVVMPLFRSALRSATTKYKSEDLYSANRGEIEKGLEIEVKRMLEERGIKVEQVLLRALTLPEKIRTAIEMKVAADQKRLQLEIEKAQAKIEADKKTIEAQGIRDAQKLIVETLNENYIRYLWVKALETAASNRTTMIYIPTGPSGMPIIDVPNRHLGPATTTAEK